MFGITAGRIPFHRKNRHQPRQHIVHQLVNLAIAAGYAASDALLQRLETGQDLFLVEHAQQVGQEIQRSANIGDVGIGSLNRREDLVEEAQLQVDRVRPKFRFESGF